jgi:hypothetical protein
METTPKQALSWAAAILLSIAIFIGLIFATIAIQKKFSIWSKEQSGRAKLAESKFSKQTKIEEAKANLESEKLNAQAEIVRAKGAAESIRAEAGGLTENYIRYLWVRQQSDLNNKTVVYVPTEAGLPVLEASRLQGN